MTSCTIHSSLPKKQVSLNVVRRSVDRPMLYRAHHETNRRPPQGRTIGEEGPRRDRSGGICAGGTRYQRRVVSSAYSACGIALNVQNSSDLVDRLSEGEASEEQRTGFSQEVASLLTRVKVAEGNHDLYLKPAVDDACDAQDAETVPPHFPSRDPSEELPGAPRDATPLKRKRESPAAAALTEMRESICEVSLPLPSDYHVLIRDHPSMVEAVKVERKLRQGQAQEALDSLKTHLTTYHSIKMRKKNVSGVIANTAQDRRLKGKVAAINKAKARYREQYAFLRLLGLPAEHSKFKPLADEDCKPFVILHGERQAGDSELLPTWIWGDSKHIARHPEGAIKEFMKHCT